MLVNYLAQKIITFLVQECQSVDVQVCKITNNCYIDLPWFIGKCETRTKKNLLKKENFSNWKLLQLNNTDVKEFIKSIIFTKSKTDS